MIRQDGDQSVVDKLYLGLRYHLECLEEVPEGEQQEENHGLVKYILYCMCVLYIIM